jgi:hypothetical protein
MEDESELVYRRQKYTPLLLPIKMRVVPILIYLFRAERFKISNVRMINFVREVGSFMFVFKYRLI